MSYCIIYYSRISKPTCYSKRTISRKMYDTKQVRVGGGGVMVWIYQNTVDIYDVLGAAGED